MMLSIGDWTDKLIIENIKIFNVRERLLTKKRGTKEYIKDYHLMMRMVANRAKISNALDAKICNVVSGRERNEFIERIRTYNED